MTLGLKYNCFNTYRQYAILNASGTDEKVTQLTFSYTNIDTNNLKKIFYTRRNTNVTTEKTNSTHK